MTDRLKIALMLSPALAVIGLLFGGGLAAGLMRSFNYMPVIGLTDPNLDAWAAVLTSPVTWRSLALSLHIAFTSTLLSALIAIAAALLLRRTFPGRRLIGFLVQLNLTIPHIVGAIGILYLFSQSGSLARLATAGALIDRPAAFPALIFDPHAIGIILHYVWKEVPFITLILLSQMQTVTLDYEAVARSHGASRGQAFRHVLLPLIAPGLIAASVIVFAFSFGAYEVPLLLGAQSPVALPVLAYRSYTDVDLAARPQAMAMAVLIAALSAGLILIALKAARTALGWRA
jgi:putative spermidine/putrescine transport system permease protein